MAAVDEFVLWFLDWAGIAVTSMMALGAASILIATYLGQLDFPTKLNSVGTYFFFFFGAVLLVMWVLAKPTFGVGEAAMNLALLSLAVATNLAMALLDYAEVLTKRFSKTWVKALDFPYLALAFGGVVRVINSSPHATDRLENFDIFGLIMVATAIGIRLAKAIIEVFFERRMTG